MKLTEETFEKMAKKLENQIFIGKVIEIIGFEKTLELLKESKLKPKNTKDETNRTR